MHTLERSGGTTGIVWQWLAMHILSNWEFMCTSRDHTYELWNLRALKFSLVNKLHIFQCMGKIFCAESFEIPHKFLIHTLKDMIFIQH